MTDDASGAPDGPTDPDVVVVGGGPAGCSAAVFTARYGLDTVVFDRGSSSLRRCAYLENYLGFPGGVDVDEFYDLAHAHVRASGGTILAETVASVDRRDGDRPLVVETTDGTTIAADSVIAATRYTGEYLEPLDDGAMFESYEYDGAVRRRFDPDYADADGRTPTEGLYVAAPAGERSVQAIVAAGHGAHVARSLLEDRRADRGFPGPVAKYYDWLRPDAEFAEGRGDREHWRASFDERLPADYDVPDDRLDDLREAYVEEVFETHLPDDAAERRRREGYDRLVAALDEERLRAALDQSSGDDGGSGDGH